MNFNALNNSVNIEIAIDADKAAEALATKAASLTHKAVKFTLDRAISDTRLVTDEVSKFVSIVSSKIQSDCRTVYNAGRVSGSVTEKVIASSYTNTKATIISMAQDATETRDAIIAATKSKLERIVSTKVVEPVTEQVTNVVTPVKELISDAEKAIAAYTESEVTLDHSDPIAAQNAINAALASESPKTIKGAIVSSNGIVETPATETVKEVAPKSRTLAEMIDGVAAIH